jgi:excinuclease ABC subunit C
LLQKDLDERAIIQQWLRGKRGGQRVVLQVPKRGPKHDLVRMATENAAVTLTSLQAQWQADTNKQTEALSQLQEALALDSPPGRIECFDVSTLQGTDTVGSMVVFEKGTASKSDYRKFSIKGKGARGEPDDYASMREMLRRRFRRAVEDAIADPGSKSRKSDASWRRLPDLLIVDGGKGQLGVAEEVLAEYQLTEVVPVVGLAKQREELFLPGKPDPVMLPPGSQGLFLIQRVRDEAHRFAITFHRQKRGQRAVTSELDAVPGIGPARRKALLKHFGSLEAIRGASAAELAAVPGMNLAAAQQIRENL